MNSEKRGFYYHFTQDLLKELKKQYLNTETLRGAVHKKLSWQQNEVLTTVKNQAFNEGIILHAWINLGDFYWNYVSKDTRCKFSKNIKAKVNILATLNRLNFYF